MRRVRTRKGAIKRSGFEDDICADLKARGLPMNYETRKLPYTKKVSTYTVDFDFEDDYGFVVEAKGYMRPADRTKHLLIQQQHPDLEVRFLFQNAGLKLSKASKTTYGEWATKHGFTWAEGVHMPEEWFE